MDKKEQAVELLREFKGANYLFGVGVYDRIGELTKSCGTRVAIVADGVGQAWATPIHKATLASLAAAGVKRAGDFIPGAGPNAPREDVFGITEALREQNPDVIVAVGGGSGIDAVKASAALLSLDDKHEMDSFFGVGQVTEKLAAEGRSLLPVVAAQLAASSGAHLTKYANITDMSTGQKLLIVDDAVVPPKAIFDYAWTVSMPRGFTMDGGLDGVAHCLEVFMGIPAEKQKSAEPVCLLGIDLVVHHIKQAVDQPDNVAAREALGLATDLGGYAIMIGGTNGAHLNSFSLVDLLPHGKACALMNPYYTVFFAPAIEDKLRKVGQIYKDAGYVSVDMDNLHGRDLGLAVAEGMLALSRDIGFPTTLNELEGFTQEHVERCLAAAKNPKLASKLQNMPVPLQAETVDKYMGPILESAKTGDFRLIRSM